MPLKTNYLEHFGLISLAWTLEEHSCTEHKEQIYGTQAQITAANGFFIWPIKEPEGVNRRRADAGFDRTIEEYAAELMGEKTAYKVLKLSDIKTL